MYKFIKLKKSILILSSSKGVVQMKKRQTNYLVIISFSLFLILILVGKNHFYGSQIDWINQHTAIPNMFRNLFYQTKKLIPNYVFNIGAGQNIFNYSYYGLMNPIILISYFLPFITMENFISITSIILYIISGLLLFRFLKSNKVTNQLSLLATLTFQTLAPITFHFHHHIMFVWYIPFLIMALVGVDKYINKNKSLLLMASIFLIILTNYYYSIPCLLTIVIYGCYKILEKKQHSFKSFLLECLKASPRIIVPIMMTAYILLPTALSMAQIERSSENIITLKSLLLPSIREIAYSSFGIGLSFSILIAPFANLCKKKLKVEEIFLSLSLIIVTLFPIFMYLLNGRLYIRGKVLIPLSILYMLALVKFISDLKNKELNLKKLYIIIGILTVIIILSNLDSIYLIPLIIDVSITCLTIMFFKVYKKNSILFIPLLTTLFICTICNNYTEIYLPDIQDEENLNIEELLDKIQDKSFHRTDILIDSNKNANRIMKDNYYNTSTYSSTYNSYYHDFYTTKIGNNIEHRNMLNTSGANNYLFNKIMGVKYIISSQKHNDSYEKISSINGINLYKNNNANPLIYTTHDYGSKTKYESMSFPYNTEYLVNHPITNSTKNSNYNSTIEQITINEKKEYKFSLKSDKKLTYNLPQPIENKILIISFDMKYNQSCEEGDTSIKINGAKNKLTCKEWIYHNKNTNFKYVITNKKELTKLNIKLSKGKYHITNIKTYTMDYPDNKYQELDNLKIDKKNSQISGKISSKEDSYLITSFPYDEGFKAFIDNKEVKKEIVNTAFLGFKVPRGKHDLKIKYTSPGYKEGIIISIIGMISMFTILYIEKKLNEKSTTIENCQKVKVRN